MNWLCRGISGTPCSSISMRKNRSLIWVYKLAYIDIFWPVGSTWITALLTQHFILWRNNKTPKYQFEVNIGNWWFARENMSWSGCIAPPRDSFPFKKETAARIAGIFNDPYRYADPAVNPGSSRAHTYMRQVRAVVGELRGKLNRINEEIKSLLKVVWLFS